MKIISLLAMSLILGGCSYTAIEMAPAPTIQKFDLSDAEGDGVISARDECPDTAIGAKVDNDGCGVKVVEKIRRKLLINFSNNSSKVEKRFYPAIEELADFLKENKSAVVTIEGHTSSVGNDKYNKKLSFERADAIKTLLVNKYGLDESRIKSIGYGSEKLLLEGSDEYIHAKNRRIVAEIVSEQKITDMKWTIYSVDERDE